MTLAEQLAERICAIRADGLPEDAVHWAKVSILDTLGVALAGSREDCARITDKVVGGGEGPCLVFGGNRRVAALDAAQMNGTSAHALDFDASNNTMAGHPSVHLLPAVYAAAELLDASGRDFVAAYVAGFETQSRIGRGVQPYQTDKGWFPSAALGVLGAAGGVAHLLKLDTKQTAETLAVGAMLACGFMAGAGTMAKPFAAGHSARNGLIAGLLVRDGFTASLDSFENRRGYLNLFNGAGHFQIEPMLANWGKPYEVGETAVGLKQHPCCGVLQSTVDVMAELMRAHKLTPDGVEKIEVQLKSKRLGHVDRPDPRSGVDAKFSTQYCVARTLENGRLVIEDFEGTAFRDPATHEVMARVVASEHPSMGATAARTAQGGVELHVTTRDGRRLSGSATQPFGRVPGEPLPTHLLHAKFLDCAERAVSADAAKRVLALLTRVETLSSVRQVSETMLEA